MMGDQSVLLVVLDKASDALHTITPHTLLTPAHHILKHLTNNCHTSKGVKINYLKKSKVKSDGLL